MSRKGLLSKSTILRNAQCAKSLYLYKNNYMLRDKPSAEKQALFDKGNLVGNIAHDLFPNGYNAQPENSRDMQLWADNTNAAIKAGKTVIYEAAFIYNDVFIAIDVLAFEEGVWNAYEVKSSIKTSAMHVLDASIQYYIATKAGFLITDFYLCSINDSYYLNGEFDVQQFFRRKSVLKDAVKNQAYVEFQINEAQNTLNYSSIPDIEIGARCFKPYSCDFIGTCWRNHGNVSVFELMGLNKVQQEELFKKGFHTIESVADNYESLELPDVTVNYLKQQINKETYFDAANISTLINKIQYPLSVLDIEVCMPAVPILQNTKAFEFIPFLFCIKTQETEQSETIDFSCFVDDVKDNLGKFYIQLLAKLKSVKTIIVFDSKLENEIIAKGLNYGYLNKDEVQHLLSKVVDLSEILKDGSFRDYRLKNSSSLKSIEEIILGTKFYQDCEIIGGTIAMSVYENFLRGAESETKQRQKQELIKYCEADVNATYNFYTFLKNKIQANEQN